MISNKTLIQKKKKKDTNKQNKVKKKKKKKAESRNVLIGKFQHKKKNSTKSLVFIMWLILSKRT